MAHSEAGTPPSLGTNTAPSPSGTAVDLPNSAHGQPKPDGGEATRVPSTTATATEEPENLHRIITASGAEIKLSQGRKWFLLLIFAVAQFLDVASYSGLFVFTEQILEDLKIPYLASSWIITAYTVTFASFLLFWGRVSDLYSAKPVFAYGFVGVAVSNLIISFLPNQYAYYVFRAISGIFGAATIPSAFRLILAIFEPSELQVALALFGLSGALANVFGLVLAGFFGFITSTAQQMLAYRWFFRMIAIVIAPFGVAAFALVPKTKGDRADEFSPREKFKRLDIIGCLMMLVGIIMLILGLTLGATNGFTKAGFIAPFTISWPIIIGFFFWEYRLPEGYALIPPNTWKIPSFALLIFVALGVYPYWAMQQLVFVERFLTVNGDTPIIAAVRMLPQGVAALALAMVTPPLLQKLKGSAKWPIGIASTIAAASYLLFIYSDGDLSNNGYWRWLFPSFIFGSGSAMVMFLSINITTLTSVPAAMSGVAGALLQVSLQLGAVIALSVQAGFLTIHPGNVENFSNVQASFWFMFGWLLLNAIFVFVFYKHGKVVAGSEAAAKLEKEGKKVETVSV